MDEIRSYYGDVEISQRPVGFCLTCWLYAGCWIRLGHLKDRDEAAFTLANACQMLLDIELSDTQLRKKLFEKISGNVW